MRPSIVLGPGDRFRPLGSLLGGLGFDLRRLHDWADLGHVAAEGALVILVDAASTPQEDIGFVRRSLEKNSAAHAITLGEDAGTRVARSLLALPRMRWMPWPPDLDDMVSITAGLRAAMDTASNDAERTTRNASAHAIASATQHASDSDEDADEIARIQAILEGDGDELDEAEPTLSMGEPIGAGQGAEGARESHDRTARSSDTDEGSLLGEFATTSRGEVAPQFSREAAPRSSREAASQASGEAASQAAQEDIARAARTLEEPTPATPPRTSHVHESVPAWWRAQVADLADAAQRIELVAQAVRLEALDDEVAEQVDALDTEVARLAQFARTLGYVAAPPGRGEQVFDLAEMVQLFVKDLASRAEAPRCLFRAPAHVWVQSDRVLLTQAFDAMFWLAGACAGGGELVRAQVKREGDIAEVRFEFPAGPLVELELERILEPYGLRRVLPDLGPNALSAARGILAGQGGRGELLRPAKGRLEWRVQLPAVEAPPNGSSTGGGPSGRPRRVASYPEAD